MKKLIALLLAALMLLGLAACGTAGDGSTASDPTPPASDASGAPTDDSSEVPTQVTVTCLNGTGEEVQVTVPYDPQRVVVVDFAALDILDNLGLGSRVVGVPTISLDYLKAYETDGNTANVGTVKTPDLEAIMACEPEIIFMAGRMSEYYDDLCEIAPVIRLISDTDLGLVESVRRNAAVIGSIFGAEEQVDALLDQYDARISALADVAAGKTALLGLCTSGGFNLLGNDGRCSLIVNEIGFDNIGADAATAGGSASRGESAESTGGSTPTHGNEASFELVVQLAPDYIFVMDRDAAIGTNGAQLAQEIMENELVMKTDAYKNGNLVILAHPGIWYTAEGGITALGIMLDDLEAALQP